MTRNPATTREKIFMAQVKQLCCCICGVYGVDLHHITQSGRRLGNSYILPLCPSDHRGANGFSGKNRAAWDKSLDNQLRLLADVYKQLDLPMPVLTSKIVKRKA